MTFSTGFQVNLGTISCLLDRGDAVYLDKQDHACIIDGARLSFAQIRKFAHNDPTELRRLMAAERSARGRLVVVDGVFSMEGDIAPLPEIVKVARDFQAALMVDDAHGLGVLGARGRGTAEHFGLEDEVHLIMGTFSKSLASIGGFIAGERSVIDHIRHTARSLIFSAALAPAAAAAAGAAVDIIESEPERREQLRRNAHFLKTGLSSLGFCTGDSRTPVIPDHRGGRRPGVRHDATARRGGRLRQSGDLAGHSARPRPPPDELHGHPHRGSAVAGARGLRAGRAGVRRHPVGVRRWPATCASWSCPARGRASAGSSAFPTRSIGTIRSWVAPLLSDRRKVLGPDNPFFAHARMALWVATRDGRDVGSVAGIVDDHHNARHGEATAFFGFFESVNDPAVSRLLLDAVRGLGPAASG